MSKRIYISGPMTAYPDNNFAAFENAAYRLRGQGHFVINPAELSALFGAPEEIECSYASLTWLECDANDKGWDKQTQEDRDWIINQSKKEARLARALMDADLAAVRSCDAIYLLCGWESSRGARKELAAALANNLEIILEQESTSLAKTKEPIASTKLPQP